jgi:predicted acylesterase/phospholipase RssA
MRRYPDQNLPGKRFTILVKYGKYPIWEEKHMEYDLVFEGGGAKGVAFVGALQAFERHGHKPRRLIGASAGSITACLIAAGYNSRENLEALNEKLPDGRSRFEGFMDTPTIYEDVIVKDQLGYWLRSELNNPLIPDVIEPIVDNLIENLVKGDLVRHLISLFLWGGWYAGDEFISWLREKLNAGGRNLADTTLLEFSQKTGRDLSVVASDLTGKEMLVLNHRTAPTLPTVWAVRMSMGCPFAWQEVIWREEWGTYRGRNLAGHRVVDGGLLSNFPISLFVAMDENIDEIMGEGMQSENVIGLLIDETLEVPGAGEPPAPSLSAPSLLDRIDLLEAMMRRIHGLAETVLSAHDKAMLSAYKEKICRLPAKGIGTMEFNMSLERREAVQRAGEAAMEAFLAGSSPSYLTGLEPATQSG